MKTSQKCNGKNKLKPVNFENKITTPSPHPKIDLRDAHAVRREMGCVYRDMRNGTISTQDGTRLAYVLDMVRKSYETATLQERIEMLEAIIKNRRKG